MLKPRGEPAWLLSGFTVLVCAGIYVAAVELPVSGPIVPELEPLAQAMTNFMTPRSFSAGTIALMKDDRLVLRQGFGWQDKEKTTTIYPDAIMRLASVSKPLTGSAITKLVNEGRLMSGTKMYPLLNIAPFGGVLGDSRLTNITIQHLLDHTAGWDRNVGPVFDPVFKTVQISTEMGLNYPANPVDVIQWMFAKPLQHAPGTSNVYSNFGYDVLGRVIEKVTGQSYTDYLREKVLGPFGITNIIQSRSRPQDRDPREIWYADSTQERSAVDYPTNKVISFADGGGYTESFDAFGGMAASAVDLCRYMQHFFVSYSQRPTSDSWTWNYVFYGSLPGTTTAIHQDLKINSGVVTALEFAVLFNQRTEGSTVDENDLIHQLLLNAANTITSWPASDGGQVQWSVPSTNVFKSDGVVTIPIVRTHGTTRTIQVSYTTHDQSAGAGDYSSQAGILTFGPGETQKSILIPIVDDGLTEPRKQFSLELISASGGGWLGDQFSSMVNILSRPQIQATAPFSNGQFALTLTGAEEMAVWIEASQDLIQWQPLETITNVSRPFVWTDRSTPQARSQFYRAAIFR